METYFYSFQPTQEKFVDNFYISLPTNTGQNTRELVFVEAYLLISSSSSAQNFYYQKNLDPFVATLMVNLVSQTSINVNLNVFTKCFDLTNVNSINIIFGLTS